MMVKYLLQHVKLSFTRNDFKNKFLHDSTFLFKNIFHKNDLQLKTLFFFTLLISGSILIRLPFINVPMISDEGAYAYTAYFWTSECQLYRDIPFDRPQGLFLIYKFFLLFGSHVLTLRILGACYNAVTVVFIFLLSQKLFGLKSAYISGATYAICSTAPSIEGFTVNAEILTLLPLVIAAYLTYKKRWFGAGLFAGIATIIKPIGISGFLLAFIWAVVLREKWRTYFGIILGYSIFLALSLIHGYYVNWDSFWTSFVDRRLLLYSGITANIFNQANKLGGAIRDTYSAWIVPAIAGLSLFARNDKFHGTWFCLIWIITSFIGMSLGGEWWWHYFQQIIPPLAVMSGALLFKWSQQRLQLFWVGLLIISMICFGYRDLPCWFKKPKDISWDLYHRPAYLYSSQIADEIEENTSPSDNIYIAFSEAEIYFLSKRFAAVPQLFYREVQLSSTIFQQVIDSIKQRKPAMIVHAQDPPKGHISFENFMLLLCENYQLYKQFGPISVYKRM